MKDENIAQMRQDLAETERENLNEGEILDILIYGIQGYAEMDDDYIRKAWKMMFEE